jgi:hypothetical protein
MFIKLNSFLIPNKINKAIFLNFKFNNKNILRKIKYNFMEKIKIQNQNQIKNIFLYDINKFNINLNISINEKERAIFDLINSVLKKNNKNTTCRVAGGWVRDKVKKFILINSLLAEKTMI